MELVRKQTYITADQDRRLKEWAERYHVTEAEVLRRALDAWLADEENARGRDPFEWLVGFVDGPTEVNHNDIYR